MGEYLYGEKTSWSGADVPLSVKTLKFCSYFQICLRLNPHPQMNLGKFISENYVRTSIQIFRSKTFSQS